VANRLQKEIKICIHENQYGFIQCRTIQDCLAWTFEYLHQCQKSKRKIIVLELDFKKASDTIEHSAIIKILRCKGGVTEDPLGNPKRKV
jgi:retron-type reverse transcriptase